VRGARVTKAVVMYQPPNRQPKIMDRNATKVEGTRHSRRPSSVAKKEGKRNITQVKWADEYDQFDDGWSDEELMPAEACKEDCSWVAGPILRELPPFRGPEPGPADASFDHNTTPVEIMLTQSSPSSSKYGGVRTPSCT